MKESKKAQQVRELVNDVMFVNGETTVGRVWYGWAGLAEAAPSWGWHAEIIEAWVHSPYVFDWTSLTEVQEWHDAAEAEIADLEEGRIQYIEDAD